MGTIIQFNKFAELHDGKRIIFCKTDFLLQEFERIKKIKNDVILISGNSDYCITDELMRKAPRNIKKWFCQNRLSDSRILQSLPMGIENSIECVRPGHGVGWEHAKLKYEVFKQRPQKDPASFIFANFTVNHSAYNPAHRLAVRKMAIELEHITWKEPFIKFEESVEFTLEHQAVLCAQGNGPGDNHRIYESLYLARVPLTFSFEQYRHLHYMFPTVYVTSLEELRDKKELQKRIDAAKKRFNKKYLDFEYWKEVILDYAKKI